MINTHDNINNIELNLSENILGTTPVSSASIACPGHSNPRLPGLSTTCGALSEACPSWSTNKGINRQKSKHNKNNQKNDLLSRGLLSLVEENSDITNNNDIQLLYENKLDENIDDFKKVHKSTIIPVSSASIACPGHSNPRLPGLSTTCGALSEACPSWSTFIDDVNDNRKIANIVYCIHDFNINNVFLLENKKNMIMDGKFTKIIYSDEFFILYGIFIKIPLFIDEITINIIQSNKYFFKFQPNHNFHEKYINEIIQIEYRILDFYKEIFNVKKKHATILRNQLYNGFIKIFKNTYYNKKHNLNESTELHKAHIYPKKIFFLLKISGVWEDSENIGLTYKFEMLQS